MAKLSIIKLYTLLSARIGTDAAEELTAYIEEKVGDEVADNVKHLSTKEDLHKLSFTTAEEFANVHSKMQEEFANVHAKMQEGFAGAHAKTWLLHYGHPEILQ